MSTRRRALLRERTFRWLEGELRDYPETKRRLEKLVGEIAERGMGISYELQAHRREASPEFSDPTGKRGTWLATDRVLSRMRDVTHTIEAVLEQLPPEHHQLVELYYWRSWSRLAVCDKLAIDPRTLQRWRRAIVWEIARVGGYW